MLQDALTQITLNQGAGIIGGLTLAPGLHKWTSTLLVPTDITISGGPDDVWIFQVAGTLTMSSAVRMNLSGGAQASNIFWQVLGAVTLGTTSHFEGNLLGATSIAVQTGATVNGRLLAQTAVTLQMNTVALPVEVACKKASLGLYAPYIVVYSGTHSGETWVVLKTEDGKRTQIAYNNFSRGEWEFMIFPDVRDVCDYRNLLPCDDPESCEIGFTISAEDAAILIDEAFALGLIRASKTNNKSSTNKSSRNALILSKK